MVSRHHRAKTSKVRPSRTMTCKTRSSRRRVAHVIRAPQSPDTRHLGRLLLDGRAYPCALGRSGITGLKREGDGGTPRGHLPILAGRYRQDRVIKPNESESKWPNSFWKRIDKEDGWCDAAFTPAYNTPVHLPHHASHEVMSRLDHLYDRLVILDWNITRKAQACGSAIFLHQARVEYRQMKATEGCIALEARTFKKLASRIASLQAIIVL